jgi:hypothetical protein
MAADETNTTLGYDVMELVEFAQQPDGSVRIEAIRQPRIGLGPVKVKCPSCPYHDGCTDKCGWSRV